MGRIGTAIAAAVLAGCGPEPFECQDNEQCTRAPGGACERNGACSYPDAECPSGRRYSELGPARAGECTTDIPVAGSSTTMEPGSEEDGFGSTDSGSDGDESSSDSGGPSLCDGVTCSDHGACVVVDDAPTCACDPGWSMVDLSCLEDPCESKNCFFINAALGDDRADGSRDAPWQTAARVGAAMAEAEAGDHYLFRRGQTFDGPVRIDVVDRTGTAQDPIVIGAYGNVADPRPILNPVTLATTRSSYVVFRDLQLQRPDASAMCVGIEYSAHVTVHDIVFRDCGLRAFRVLRDSAYIAIVGNEIRDIGDKAAIFLADAGWTEPPSFVGSHHWIVDNLISGNGEHGIDVVIAGEDEVGDVKVVGNQLANIESDGVFVRSPFAWVQGNAVFDAGMAGGDDVGMRVVSTQAQVRGNIVSGGPSGLFVTTGGVVANNTILQVDTGNALRVGESNSSVTVLDNVVGAHDTTALRVDTTSPLSQWVTEFDRNLYSPAAGTTCPVISAGAPLAFEAWQRQSQLDESSRCGVLEGFEPPPSGVLPPFDATAFAPLSPATECESRGALDCDANLRPVELQALSDFDEADGAGWAGPLIVRQRYTVAP